MVANLFCRLAGLLRIKNHAFGSVAKITVKCLQGLTQALDLKTLVKINSDIVRTGLLTFFNNCADDLFIAVKELNAKGQHSLLRGENLKSWISIEFANQMIIPVLTTLFLHIAKNHFGTDLLLDEIQAACYKILDSLYMVTGIADSYRGRKSINYEIEKLLYVLKRHRPGLGQCLSAFASCFPVAFLEGELNNNNKYSVLAKSQEASVQVQEMLQTLSQHIPELEKLLQSVENHASNSLLYNEHSNVYDVDLPLLCSYLSYWWQLGPDGSLKTPLPTTFVKSDHINRIFCTLLKMMKDHVGVENAPWLCRINFFAVPLIQHVTCDPVKEYLLPIAERLRKMAEKAYKEEERQRTHPDDADEGTVAEDNARLVRDVYQSCRIPDRREISSVHLPSYAAEIRKTNASLTSNAAISLSFDECSKKTRRFLSVTCSYINDEWKLKFHRIAVESFNIAATGQNIAEKVQSIMAGMQYKKIVGITRDGASNVLSACNIMERNDSVHCYDHALSLSLKYALNNTNEVKCVIDKVVRLAASFSRSPSSSQVLKDCGAKESMKCDQQTRWTWMIRAVNNVLRNKEALEKFVLHTEGRKSSQKNLILQFDEADYVLLEDLHKVLKFFDEQLKMAEGREATASAILYFAFQAKTMASKKGFSSIITKFLKSFLTNFEPRREKYCKNEAIQIATYLDPRFCKRLELFTAVEWAIIEEKVIEKLKPQDDGENEMAEEEQLSDVEVQEKELEEMDDLFGWANLESGLVMDCDTLKKEIEGYSKDARISAPLPGKSTTDLALNYWKINKSKYPQLRSLAKEYLSIMASSAEPERVFSSLAGVFQNDQRSSLSDESIEDIMVIRNQIYVEKAEMSRKAKPDENIVAIFEINSDVEDYENE